MERATWIIRRELNRIDHWFNERFDPNNVSFVNWLVQGYGMGAVPYSGQRKACTRTAIPTSRTEIP